AGLPLPVLDATCRTPRRRKAMRLSSRIGVALIFMLSLSPASARAIQLRWQSGAHDICFEAATRCTLVVQADNIETSLPKDLTPVWVADPSAAVQVASEGPDSC